MTKIITHSGPAHFDDFFAVCLILASSIDKFEIERRDPTTEELNNPDIWVVDVGGTHDPSLKNFDHHHDIDSDCAYVLVADHLGYKELLQNIPWWDVKNKLDTKGPTFVREKMHLTSEEFLSLGSPLEKFMLEAFSSKPNDLIDLMRDFGRRNINNALKYQHQMIKFEQCEKIYIKDHVIMLIKDDDVFACERYAEQQVPKISLLISYDNRGKGWSILRFFDNPKIDLFKLDGNPKIKFAHKNGFVAKTHEKIPLPEVIELIQLSL